MSNGHTGPLGAVVAVLGVGVGEIEGLAVAVCDAVGLGDGVPSAPVWWRAHAAAKKVRLKLATTISSRERDDVFIEFRLLAARTRGSTFDGPLSGAGSAGANVLMEESRSASLRCLVGLLGWLGRLG